MPEIARANTGLPQATLDRIQGVADRTRQTIYLVGSRADGTAAPNSDWDYILTGDSGQIQRAKSSLPGWSANDNHVGGVGGVTNTGRGIDIWQGGRLAAPPHARANNPRLVPNAAFFANVPTPQITLHRAPYTAVDDARPYVIFRPADPDTVPPRMDFHPNRGGHGKVPGGGVAFTVSFRE